MNVYDECNSRAKARLRVPLTGLGPLTFRCAAQGAVNFLQFLIIRYLKGFYPSYYAPLCDISRICFHHLSDRSNTKRIDCNVVMSRLQSIIVD